MGKKLEPVLSVSRGACAAPDELESCGRCVDEVGRVAHDCYELWPLFYSVRGVGSVNAVPDCLHAIASPLGSRVLLRIQSQTQLAKIVMYEPEVSENTLTRGVGLEYPCGLTR